MDICSVLHHRQIIAAVFPKKATYTCNTSSRQRTCFHFPETSTPIKYDVMICVVGITTINAPQGSRNSLCPFRPVQLILCSLCASCKESKKASTTTIRPLLIQCPRL